MPATRYELVKRIVAIAPQISRGALHVTIHAPETWARHTQCFNNAETKVTTDGGSVTTGWYFIARNVAALGDRSYIFAVHHAVWTAPDNTLVDVTPFHPDPNHHPITENGGVVFLIDDDAPPLKSGTAGLALPSWFFPMTPDKALATYVAKIEAKELDQWERDVSRTDGLRGSARAAGLLRSRRDRL